MIHLDYVEEARKFIDSLDVTDLDDTMTVERLAQKFEKVAKAAYDKGYAEGAWRELMEG